MQRGTVCPAQIAPQTEQAAQALLACGSPAAAEQRCPRAEDLQQQAQELIGQRARQHAEDHKCDRTEAAQRQGQRTAAAEQGTHAPLHEHAGRRTQRRQHRQPDPA